MNINYHIDRNKLGKYKIIFCVFFLILIGIACLYNIYPRIEFELTSTNAEEIVQVYYLDKNMSNFDGEHLVWDVIDSGTKKYSFHIPNTNMVRIDFGTSAGTNRISNIIFKTIFTVKEIPVQFIETGSFSEDVGDVWVEGDRLFIESIGLDSYVVVSIDEIQSEINLYVAFVLLFALIIIIMLSVIIVRYQNKIENFINITPKHAVIISCCIFFITKILFLLTHIGYFAIDEFHHLSTLNPDYSSNYNMGLFVNYTEKFICVLFGQNDCIVKIAPFIMGTISFLCGLYLLYNIYENPYWIVTISMIFIYMPYLLVNHFYIRMYVFLEAIVMLDSVFLYNAGKSRGTKREKVYLLLVGIVTLIYSLTVNDITGHALLLLMLAAVFYYLYSAKVKNNIKTFQGKKLLLCLVCGLGVLFLIALKNHWLDMPLELFFNGGHAPRYIAEKPVFLQFVFGKIFYISIPFIASLAYAWLKRAEDKKILLVIAGLPLSGYIVFFHSSYYLRSYVAFLPVVCIMAYYVFDKIKISKMLHLTIIFFTIVATLNIEDNFWKRPRIPNELAFANLGGAAALAKDYEKQGYEIVTLLTSEKQLAYFDLLDIDINLNSEDTKKRIWSESNPGEKYGEKQYSDNSLSSEAIGLINEEIERMIDSDVPKVLITDEAGTGIFWSAYENDWKDKFTVKRFGETVNIIVIN